jgi:ATPases with chaperone activity, ATP-binding subunit
MDSRLPDGRTAIAAYPPDKKEITIMANNNENTFLSRFAVNLNERASAGKLDPVIGRDDEIRRVLQILSRRTKNNPILVGEPGVGKTAISEGIAQNIVSGRRAGEPEDQAGLFPGHGRPYRGREISR